MAEQRTDGDVQSPERSDLQEQIDCLREQVTINRADIDDLQADGLLERTLLEALQQHSASQTELNEQLRRALLTSRTIGVAIGIVMAKQSVTQEAAFDMLRKLSNDTNRKLRDVAEHVVATGTTVTAVRMPRSHNHGD